MSTLTEELYQLKELLDAGVITQEDFDGKKKELLSTDYVPAKPVEQASAASSGEKSKLAAGLLAIFLGALGIHKFYLGYQKEGIIMLVVSLVTFGIGGAVMGIIGIIEGIMYLTKTDEEFYAVYAAGQKPWF